MIIRPPGKPIQMYTQTKRKKRFSNKKKKGKKKKIKSRGLSKIERQCCLRMLKK